MKIYTKGGDRGETSLLGGTRVRKDHIRIEAYGTVDELSAAIGLVHSQPEALPHRIFLERILNNLFVLESNMALEDKDSENAAFVPALDENSTDELEQEIDRLNKELPKLKNFVLPAGSQAVAFCHLARTICRRAERTYVTLLHDNGDDQIGLRYLNRLSDYLFVLARSFGWKNGIAEIAWKPND